jgi:hypothetical protein
MAGDSLKIVKEISLEDYELWRWLRQSRDVLIILREISRTRVSFYIREDGTIDRHSLEIIKKI